VFCLSIFLAVAHLFSGCLEAMNSFLLIRAPHFVMPLLIGVLIFSCTCGPGEGLDFFFYFAFFCAPSYPSVVILLLSTSNPSVNSHGTSEGFCACPFAIRSLL